MPGFYMTATGTDVGKTFVGCALIRALIAEGREVDAFKPVLSGYEGYPGSDAARLLDALGRSEGDLDAMSPLRFIAPLAPPSAARIEGKHLGIAELIGLCEQRLEAAGRGLLMIEGAGGVMSPIAEEATNLDLIVELDLPVVLVAGSYLGSVSHTLTALAALESAQVTVLAVVVSESPGSNPSLSEMTDALAEFAPLYPVVVAPRVETWSAQALAALV